MIDRVCRIRQLGTGDIADQVCNFRQLKKQRRLNSINIGQLGDFCEEYGDDNSGWLLMTCSYRKEMYSETDDDSDNDDNFDDDNY